MSGEKTEEASPEKLKKAREKGQLPSKKNTVEIIVLVIGFLVLSATWDTVARSIADVMEAAVEMPIYGFTPSYAKAQDAIGRIIQYALTVTGVLGMVGLVGTLLLNKFNFAPKAMTPNFGKLNPVSGLKGLFSMNTIYNGVRMAMLFVVIGVGAYLVIYGNMGDGIEASICGLSCLIELFSRMIHTMVIMFLASMALFALVDFKIQHILFMKKQKMSKDDVKQEHKNSEGDGQIKGQRQNIAEENLYLPTMKEVTHVVYSNSTLVALMNIPNSAPFVVMKSTGSNVPKLQYKFRQMGKKCINMAGLATRLHKIAKVNQRLEGKEAARIWFKILNS